MSSQYNAVGCQNRRLVLKFKPQNCKTFFSQATMQDVSHPPAILAYRLSVPTCRSPLNAADRNKQLGVRTEDGQPRSFLHVTEPFSRHCLTHLRISFEDWASCRSISWLNPCWFSTTDSVRINTSTANTYSQTPQRSMSMFMFVYVHQLMHLFISPREH